MDPVTHTLVGAALARTRLRQRTGMATATCLIGANLPDVDVLSYLWGSATALGFRRGATHGILALLVLPVVLTLCISFWDAALRRIRRGRRQAVLRWQVLLLATIAVATHPLLDFLNVYGMRWLMPFSGRWLYGDALFIIDPWVWAALVAGLWWSRNHARATRVAFILVAAYGLSMGGLGALTRQAASRLAKAGGLSPVRIMAAPAAVTPFSRWVVVETASAYHVGVFDWSAPRDLDLVELPFAKTPPQEAEPALARDPAVRSYLRWARFPYYLVTEDVDGYLVHLGDARYTVDPTDSWAAISVRFARASP